MIRIATVIALCLASTAAWAQYPVHQSGPITPGHGVEWITTGVIGDTGASPGGAITANPGQILGNYGSTAGPVYPVNWMASGATASPNFLTAFQDFVNTSGGTTSDVRCMWNPGTGGTPGCVPWMTLDQATGNLLVTVSQLQLSPSGVVTGQTAGTANGLQINQNLTGTAVAFAANGIFINDYATADPGITGATGIGFAVLQALGFNGTSRFEGSRAAILGEVLQASHGAIQNQQATQYVGVQGFATAQAAECLTSCSLTYLNSIGAIFGFNSRAVLLNGALNFTNATSYEADIGVAAGASVWLKTGIQIGEDADDAVAGVVEALILFGAQTQTQGGGAVAPGFMNGLLVGSVSPVSYTPMNALGTFIKSSGTWNLADIIDFSSVTLSGCAFNMLNAVTSAAQCVIGKNGGLTPGAGTFAADVGQIYANSVDGLVITASLSGGTYDLDIANIGGTCLLCNPDNTTNVIIANGVAEFFNSPPAVTINGTLNLVPSTSGSPATTKGLTLSQYGPQSGSSTGPNDFNTLSTTFGSAVTDGQYGLFYDGETGANLSGRVLLGLFQLNQGTSVTSNGDLISLAGTTLINATYTGTGQHYGINAGCIVQTASISLNGCNGLESDTGLTTGVSANIRNGIRIVNQGTVQATADSGLLFTSTQSAGLFQHGINFSNQLNDFPINSTGDLVYADTSATVGSILNLANLTVTNYIINSPNYTLSGAGVGQMTARAATANTNLNGFILQNLTTASSGNQQYSPSLTLTGTGWTTASSGSSETVNFQSFVTPIQGNPLTAELIWEYQIAGGGYIALAGLTSGGVFAVTTGFEVNNIQGLASKTCTLTTGAVAAGVTFTITGGIVTATSGC